MQVVFHVAVRRIDDDGGSIDHVVPGEQPIFGYMAITEMVRCVSRRVHGFDGEFFASQLVAILEYSIRYKRLVLILSFGRRHAQQFSAGRCRKQTGRR